MTITYGSVCSGIEAASVAWHPLGWTASFLSEIDAFPRAVLSHHYPAVPLHGDFTTIQKGDYAAIDLLVGGTPCQSFSVAGLRAGLDDPRGNLMLEFGALAARLAPRWLVWENVPGVLSSNGGRDFGTFLGMLAELGYGFAYRVLDAQFFGVAQRRRRVFVVGYLGDWHPAAAVLFERHSMSGHPAPSREAGKVAPTIPSRSTGGGGLGTDFDLDGGVIEAQSQWGDLAGSLTARHDSSPCADRGMNVVAQPYTLAIRGRGDSHNLEYRQDGTANALLTPNGGRGGIGVGAVAFAQNQRDEVRTMEVAGALAAEPGAKQQTYVAFHPTQDPISSTDVCHSIGANDNATAAVAVDTYNFTVTGNCTGSLTTTGGPPLSGPGVLQAMQVRRLTPVECERLQGFPDNYTAIPWRKKPASECPDGPRYKALGNSMAVPVMHWIGSRIAQVDAIIGSGV